MKVQPMSVFPSLPNRAHLEHFFTTFPKGTGPLLAFHDVILRGPSPLSIAQRELIAAYVSALNACEFCFGAHKTMAQAFGIDPDLIDRLLSDMGTSGVEPAMVPILAYAEKVTRRDSILPGDARAVLDAGWSEEALSDALMVTALFNFMNRVVDGAGLSPKASYERPTAEDLETRRNGTYQDWGRQAGFLAD